MVILINVIYISEIYIIPTVLMSQHWIDTDGWGLTSVVLLFAT